MTRETYRIIKSVHVDGQRKTIERDHLDTRALIFNDIRRKKNSNIKIRSSSDLLSDLSSQWTKVKFRFSFCWPKLLTILLKTHAIMHKSPSSNA